MTSSAVAEQSLGGRVERLDEPLGVNDDDAVDGRVKNGLEYGFHMARILNSRDGGGRDVSVFARNSASLWMMSEFKLRNIPLMEKKSAPSVLVVDDEALIRWSLAEMLGERGYLVKEAGDGRMALAAIRSAAAPFDVVLLDYRLPDSADLRLLVTVRQLAPTSRVIMITAQTVRNWRKMPSRSVRIA